MIKQLISAHQASLQLITSLRAQLDSYRVHTNALKGELSAACRRQLTSMAASLDCYQVSSVRPILILKYINVYFRKMNHHWTTGKLIVSSNTQLP